MAFRSLWSSMFRRSPLAVRLPAVVLDPLRRCQVEPLERRQLLAADVTVGAVYHEDAGGQDQGTDLLQITFKGGEPGTQLKQLKIETDKLGDGLTIGDTFFDTAPGGAGAFGSSPFVIVSKLGIDSATATVTDGGTTLVLNFVGFDPGETFIFSIDVDEQGFLGPNAVAEGNEFEGSKLTAIASAPHFFDATVSDIFFDAYDNKFAGSGLDLPPDDYTPPGTTPQPVLTAGAIVKTAQVPLPITLSGTVFEDRNLNNVQNGGDNGIAGVNLSLWRFNGQQYVNTGKTAVTNASGAYQFNDVLPGKYRILEAQPGGYFSIGATAGKVNGVTNGAVTNADTISDIVLLGGQDSVHNDFAEALPATLSGRVYHDADNDGVLDPTEQGIGGVTIEVQYLPPAGPAPAPSQVITGADGSWSKTGLRPGNYLVREIQPPAYLDGLDSAGSAGGAAHNPGDLIDGIFLGSGQVGQSYNFGELVPSKICGRVYADIDGDCEFDPGEPLLAGVTVHLLDAAGNRIQTTTTNAEGRYEFTGLRPGSYGVEEIQPAGYFDSDDHVGSAGGVLVAPDTIKQITLTSGTQAVDYNFCEHLPVSIAGQVHADIDGDCEHDPGEPLLQGVTVFLLDASGNRIASTTTNAQGNYEFEGLAPGTYGVEEIQPAGYFDSEDHVGSAGGMLVGPDSIKQIVLTSGVNATDYNFCEHLPVSVSGRVHADIDGDCELDPGEPLLAGVTVFLLDASGNRIASTTTDAQGKYKFEGLAPGTYGVEEIQPAGYFDSEDHIGSAGGVKVGADSVQQIVLTSGVNATDYNFCENLPVSISGRVHADIDGDCEHDPGEPLLAGVTVFLLDAAGNRIQTTITDAQGNYKFAGLAPGTYGVEEVTPVGYFDSEDHVGSAGGVLVGPDSIRQIVLTSALNAVNYNFCENLPASISGRVHADMDGDCEFDPGEPVLSGVTVFLLDAAGNRIRSTTTDAQGNYKFEGLAPGTYGVEEVTPPGYFDSEDHIGSAGGVLVEPDTVRQIVLTSGLNATEYNFCENLPAGIAGYVYADDNYNGVRDAGEAGISGVVITLLNSAGASTGITTVTGADGRYAFDGLAPEVYGVAESQPSGFLDGGDTVGSAGGFAQNPGDRITGATLTSGLHADNYNFGEVRPASLIGRVFADGNGNITFDDGETPLSGVTVYLLDAAGNRVSATITNAGGEFRFDNLPPGVYGLEEITPAGYLDSGERVGSAGGVIVANDIIRQITLSPGQTGTDYEFCEELPGSLSGFVFQDGSEIVVKQGETLDVQSVRNGQRDPNDRPIANVRLRLADSFGLAVLDAAGKQRVAVTNAQGFYEFTGLRPGSYVVIQEQPAGYVDGIDTPGSTGGLALNAGVNVLGLDVGTTNDAIARIPLAAGQFSINNNFSEVLVRPETPINPVPPPTPTPPPPNTRGPNLGSQVGPVAPSAPAIVRQTEQVLFGGGGPVIVHTWHLSVVDAGQPRDAEEEPRQLAHLLPASVNMAPWLGDRLNTSRWIVPGAQAGEMREFHFGNHRAIPITGDFDGDGASEAGVFIDGEWFIDLNGNGLWDEEDLWAELGHAGDQPITGDWDGDGKTDIGIFGPAWPGDPRAVKAEPGLPEATNHPTGKAKNMPPDPDEATIGVRRLQRSARGVQREDLIDHVFHYGVGGDRPVAGDWNGDGIATIGVFRDGEWILDTDGDGKTTSRDQSARFGQPGDVPVVGDFNGDGLDEIGVFRNGAWYIDTNGNRTIDPQDRVIHLGARGDRPVVGDWNADGTDEAGVYQPGAAEESSSETVEILPPLTNE